MITREEAARDLVDAIDRYVDAKINQARDSGPYFARRADEEREHLRNKIQEILKCIR